MGTRYMRRLAVGAIAALVTIFTVATSSAEVLGGYVNSRDGLFVAAMSASSRNAALLAGSVEPIVINRGSAHRVGQLFLVMPNGRYYLFSRAYRDRYGVSVALPTGQFDKIAFLDSSYRIVGGIGLADSEIKALASSFRSGDLYLASSLSSETNIGKLFESFSLAADSVRTATRMSQDEQRELFSMALGGSGGFAVQRVVDGIVDAAEESDLFNSNVFADIFDVEPHDAVSAVLLRGVGVISEGDNGGPLPGYVAEGDNGGPLPGYVAEGMKIDLSDAPIPYMGAIDATCSGTFVLIY